MFLALDIGNTKIALGLFDTRLDSPSRHLEAPTLKASWRLTSQVERTADEYRILITALLAERGLTLQQISTVALGSVVPTLTPTLLHAFAPSTRVLELTPQSNFTFQNLASPPSQVGIDRLLNAEAALRQWNSPCIIVDSGTATTLCAIRFSGPTPEYLGGAIMPGIELSIAALAKRAAKLFTVDLVHPAHAIGSNTRDAIQSGIILGYAEMIDGMIRRFSSELPASPRPRVIATGGVSEFLRGLTREIEFHDPELTLKGIYYVAHSTLTRNH
jgi:type III pantothenate kinase